MNEETQKLSQLLNQESLLATNLLELMQHEREVLESNKLDSLNTITTSKADCLDQMEMMSRTRAQLLLSLSSAPTTIEKMNQYIAGQSDSERKSLQLSVDQLEKALEQCQHQNSINGMVVSMSQRNVQRNLDIIKGVDHESMTYTQKGQTTSVGKRLGGLKV